MESKPLNVGDEKGAPSRRPPARVLIAEDDLITRERLKSVLGKLGYEVVATVDGKEAWEVFQRPDAPRLAIVDWMMPHMDGLDFCRYARRLGRRGPTYIILLTAMDGKDDIVTGLEAGADDYITKPFNVDELRARLNVGLRMLALQTSLSDRVAELQEALDQIKTLQGLLPICAWCKDVRSDDGYWLKIESYLGDHSDASFTHSICPKCAKKMDA